MILLILPQSGDATYINKKLLLNDNVIILRTRS